MNTGTGQGVDPQAGAEIEEKDVADKVEKLAEQIDAPKVYGEKDVECSTRIVDVPETDPHTLVAQACYTTDTSTAEVNDNQHIDVARIKKYVNDRLATVSWQEAREVYDQILELCDLAQEAGFLKEVQEARQELSGEEAEKVLPSIP